jgi:hypothetical protein
LASFLGGNIALLVNFKRHTLIQEKALSTEKEDFLIRNRWLVILLFDNRLEKKKGKIFNAS